MNTQRRPTSYVTLDLTLPDVQTSLAVTQGDTTRRIVATIQDGGRPFELPRKWTAMLTGTKPDGKFLYNSCVIDYSGRIVYDFASGTEIATAIGDYAVTFEIYDEAGDKVSSPSLWLSVKPDKTRDHASNDQFTAAQEILGRLNKVEDGLDFLEGDQDSEYLAYEGASLIRVNKEAPSGYDALTVSSAVDGLHIVKFDSTLYEVATNELAGYWVEIKGKRAYVGSNTVDSLTLYTDHTKTRPSAFFVSAGTLIHILGDDVTDDMLGVIGAAPAGHGLGEKINAYINDANDIKTPGLYQSFKNTPVENENYYIYHNVHDTGKYENQLAIKVLDGTMAIRVLRNTVWQPWEWVNPPMQVGVEYRTTERCGRNPVYKRKIDLDSMASNGSRSYTVAAEGALSEIVARTILVKNSYGTVTPLSDEPWGSYRFHVNSNRLEITVNTTLEGYTGTAILAYTKV